MADAAAVFVYKIWFKRFWTTPFRFSQEEFSLVRRSASLSWVLAYDVLHSSCAATSRINNTQCSVTYSSGRIRDGRVFQDRLVVTWFIGGTLAWDPHHSELVADTSKIFTTLLHCYELWSKAAWLQTGLLLGEPMYSSTVEMYQKTGPWSSSQSVIHMVCIKLDSQNKTYPLWLRHIWGGVLLSRQRAQTNWMSSTSIRRGMYQSMDCWDRVLALNYGTRENKRKPGSGGSGVLLAVAPDGATSWKLPNIYLFFPAQKYKVGFRCRTESTLLQKVWAQGRHGALDGMIFWGKCQLLQVASTDPLIAWRHMPPRSLQPSWRIGMSLKPNPWHHFLVWPVL